MAVIGLVGAQWGDEGKGKLIDILAEKADIVVRAQGGDNAGHTVVIGNETYKLHLIPSGIFYKNKFNFIAAGTVINPQSLLNEMDNLVKRGISIDRLKIDSRAHVIFPFHKKIDELSETAKGQLSIGTTKKGIGPCYMDKTERAGLRICDIISPNFKEKLAAVLALKNDIIVKIYNDRPLDLDEIYNEYLGYAKRLAPFVADVSSLIYDAIKQKKEILFEGAQGTLLDLDMGTYPYVTSSHPTAGGFTTGAGIGPTLIDQVIGVSKSYTTRVGMGPFPTELDDEVGKFIQVNGNEVGTTTGRIRRCGWLDLVILKYAARVNGLTQLVINKLDTLSSLKSLKVCIAYELDGKEIKDFPPDLADLKRCKPIYKDLKGWDEDLTKLTDYKDLPKAVKDYVEFIEKEVEVRVSMVGVGQKREQNLIR
ncbi:MAG: adenylosuccinate synthase [Firmicutes bacterium]|nr:adenylosuccinate synthase [Bacillota bacterium]